MTGGTDVAIFICMVIAVTNWQGGVSPVFDVSDRLCVVETSDGAEVRRATVLLKSRDPFGRAREVAAAGVEVLICGAVSHAFENALISSGILVLPFVCGDLEAVIGAFLQGGLMDNRFLMPGCFGKRQNHGFRCRRGRRAHGGVLPTDINKRR
ncbi:MAG TPA: NifB/NifX family molybdenum-iron cluster-binding protein [Syntrophorhabdaceae bacterium]|nr:NifB/NifX family molybdenum-iron cluster-binding protein [Syntrophorhabdaceae bacterium]